MGELGKPAELVAEEAIDQFWYFFSTEGTVDEYLADQLLIPLAFANSPSTYTTCKVTRHLLTNAEVIKRFLPSINIRVQGILNKFGIVYIQP